MNHKPFQTYFFFIFLAAVFGLAFLIFRSYFNSLVLAAALAIVFQPMYRRLVFLLGGGTVPGVKPGRESLASLLSLLIVLAIVVAPLVFLISLVFGEARGLYWRLIGDGSEVSLFRQLLLRLQFLVTPLVSAENLEIKNYLRQILTWLISNLGALFSSLTEALVSLFVSFFALYYFFKDGYKLKTMLINYSPLSNQDDEQILNKLQLAVNSVIKGSLSVALIQGVLAGLGFAFFGLPNPSIWGTLTVFAALIPGIGTSLVLVPAVVYLLIVGAAPAALGLAIWGFGIVGTIDNFIRPRLIGRGAQIHPFIILLSVFGGIAVFGMIGFLIGPLTMSLFFALLNIYKKDFQPNVI